MLFNDAVSSHGYFASLTNDVVGGMKTDKGRPKYSKRNMSEFQFFQQKCKMNWPGNEAGRPR